MLTIGLLLLGGCTTVKMLEIFLTGSSAKLLSKEIATSLAVDCCPSKFGPIALVNLSRAKKTEIDLEFMTRKTKD